MGVWPLGIVGMLLSIVAVTMVYALLCPGGPPLATGVRFGTLIGVFAVGSFVLHNHVNLNISLRLTVGQAVAYLFQWIIVGIVISMLYRPA